MYAKKAENNISKKHTKKKLQKKQVRCMTYTICDS